MFLSERLHNPDAGDGVCQHVDHLGPRRAPSSEPRSHASLNARDDPGDERKGQQAHQGHLGIQPEQEHRGDQNHDQVGSEIHRMDREKVADPLGVIADS